WINKEISMYQRELEKITYLKGQDTDGQPKGSGNGDMTAELAMEQKKYHDLIADAEYRRQIQKNKVLAFISTIDDSLMRQIIFYRDISNLPWEIVAQEIGGSNTPDSVRMLHNRFFNRRVSKQTGIK
ncbi:MAG: hypothetical protein NC086_06945, partial [Alistipes sp.]|nr:hypothetical protein [Alistipes sp.]